MSVKREAAKGLSPPSKRTKASTVPSEATRDAPKAGEETPDADDDLAVSAGIPGPQPGRIVEVVIPITGVRGFLGEIRS